MWCTQSTLGVHGTGNTDETACTCSKIYVGDLVIVQSSYPKKLGGSLAKLNLPYAGPIVMSKYNLGKHMNTRKAMTQLDLPSEVPRFLGSIGPPQKYYQTLIYFEAIGSFFQPAIIATLGP